MHVLPLADELFLIGHDENSGKPLISDAAMDTALAGALLAELALWERITATEGTLVVALNNAATGDDATDAALTEIMRQAQHHPVRAWVEHLRDTVRPVVAQHLIRVDLIERVETRVMLKSTVRYPARDRIAAAAPEARLRYMLDHPGNMDERTALLAGLVLAAGLEFVLGGASPREIKRSLTATVELLRPDLQRLVSGVESAVAALVMSGRR